ncbi:leucine-rich repeat domain-containing protein [Leptolyngbya sp. AN03gr2]|uniref:leucine-rich repeat domain-containing protein n=1 Tax=unclassified Leptolyngbya TaxID=2650499 RepID=UPI003D31435D
MSQSMTHDELLKLIDQAAAEGWEELDLSGKGLESLPLEIGKLTGLKSLNLFDNQLTVIPDAIAQLTNLTTLYLSFNQLTVIPDAIAQLTNLTTLYLSFNQLTVIPDAIAQLTNLTTLHLSGNRLTVIPDAIAQLTNLTTLFLSSNQLTVIPDTIAQLTNLTTLHLSGNRLTVIPDAIAQLTNLTTLDLSRNQLTVIPDAIAQLTNLTELSFYRNQLTVIPDVIARLTNLTTLSLSRNQLTVIPDAIAQLTNLTTLDLLNNQLTVIPDAITQLINLTELSLFGNELTVIPDAIARLTNLTKLDLSRNQLTVIPNAIARLTNLTKLDLYNNQLAVIPDAITQLTNLTTLSLSRNQLTVIPDAIAQLTNLTTLDLLNNQLTVIPDAIARLTNLTTLSLSSNQLTVIPDMIAQLTNLTTLDLFGNRITEIPSSITSLSELEELDLRGNPLSIPRDILDPPETYGLPAAKPILDYYFTVRDPNQTTHLHEAKLLIVGEGGAGKTSLAQKLLDPDYELTPETEDTSTQGIDILKWEFQGTNGKDYCINIWDFGGQEIYHQTHQFFLTDRSLYLLVADSRKEDTDHPYWLNIVRLLSDNSPVLLIQNEKQNRTCTLNLRELRAEFDKLSFPTPINLADNRGLSDLRKTIQRALEDLLGDGLPFPNRWLNVRHSLENDNRNYIPLTDYEATCRRHGITERSEMLDLSRFLHSLGICLHFQKDPILRNTFILKPNWGTAAVYKVLDNDRVKQNLGQFHNSDLAEIWSSPEYANLHHELLQLMKEFKVCYEIPRRPGYYIAPHLLSPASPNYPWDSTHNLTLRYRYQGFMPKGILTRFIVEMHRQIENVSCPGEALVWKTGVVLTNGSARAEILENQTHREIQIRVSGNRPRDFLTVINHQFEEIHASFDDRLNYDTLIPCNCNICKSSKTPFTFPLDRLYTCLDRGRYQIECHESGEDVQVRGLIDGVIEPYFSEPDSPDFNPNLASFRKRDRRFRSYPKRDRPIVIENHIHNTNQQAENMNNDKIWNGDRIDGDKVMGDKVAGNKQQIGTVQGDAIAGNKIVHSQNLAQAAQDIKSLLDQISAADSTNNNTLVAIKAIEEIEKNPTLKARIINAGKEAGFAALDAAVDHPAVKIVTAAIKGAIEAS